MDRQSPNMGLKSTLGDIHVEMTSAFLVITYASMGEGVYILLCWNELYA